MQRIRMTLAAAGLLGAGYLLGQANTSPATLHAAAQQTDVTEISSDTLVTYKKTFRTTNDLADMMRAENLYDPASEGLNYFALSVGGIDVIRDLEEGRGVDPETFAALYADRATPEVSQHLDTDPNGRIRYKGTVVRMYSRDRLKEVFRNRDQLEVRSRRVTD